MSRSTDEEDGTGGFGRPAGLPQAVERAAEGRGGVADPGEAGRADDAGGVAGGASEKKGVRGRAEEALEALGRVSPATNRRCPLTMVCGTWGRAVERVRVAGEARQSAGVRSPTAWEAGPEDGTERRGAGGRDPDGAEGESVPRRGPPEGEGAACGQGDPGRQDPGAEADAGEWAAGAGAAGPSPWRLEPQRPDPDREAGRALGHGRVAVLDEGGGLVPVLRGRRPIRLGRPAGTLR